MEIGADNRLFKRVEGELGVRYSPQGSNREFCTTIKNISGGGIRVSLLKRLERGELLDLEIFKYNTDIRARCRGRVVWIWDEYVNRREGEDLFEAGIEFVDSHPLRIARLINYIENKE